MTGCTDSLMSGSSSVLFHTFFKMNARVREGYGSTAERASGVEVVPVGNA